MAELDLVCGPADPLPESQQSFRLTERLGSGGQADVYKAVRQSAGVSSAPVTVKVFRPEQGRPIEAQFRSWDKGDAVLMDLLGRGVPGICRRIDAFYGPPPHRTNAGPDSHRVPYQVLEYLPGKDLRQLLSIPDHQWVDGIAILRTVAEALDAMHRPHSPEVHPALHMDIKPANIIISPTGEAKVIDFTGARYSVPTHITTISYTPEAAGPEARDGRVGPSYDVHGFGAVAYFLITGVQPRDGGAPVDATSGPVQPVRNHPFVDADQRLRAHLLAPLADDPRDRPTTAELPGWIDRLAELMAGRSSAVAGVGWTGAALPGTIRVPQQSAHSEAATLPELGGAAQPSTRRLGEAEGIPTTRRLGEPDTTPSTRRLGEPATAATSAVPSSGRVTATASVSPGPAPGTGGHFGRGVATPTRSAGRVPEEEPPVPTAPPEPPAPKRPWTGPGGKLAALSSGSELSVVGALFAFVCWGLWTWDNFRESTLGWQIFVLVLCFVVAAGVFAIARLIGTILLVRLLGRTRRTARLSHLAAGIFLVLAGVEFLQGVSWFVTAWDWVSGLF